MSEPRPLALSLTVRNATRLDNGSPLNLVLDRRSATIGRASSTDWSLPDPDLHISSRHCDVLFRNGGYELVDNSTNGTFVNAEVQRLTGPHRLKDGDLIRIGKYEVAVAMVPAGATKVTPAPPPAPKRPSASPRVVRRDPPAAKPAAGEDIWSRFAASNAIDWEKSFAPPPPPAPSPPPPPEAAPEPAPPEPEPRIVAAPEEPAPASVAVAPPPAPEIAPVAPAPAPAPAAPSMASAPTPPPIPKLVAEAPRVAAAAPAGAGPGLDAFLAGAGLDKEAIGQDDVKALQQAGLLLRKLVAGMVVMLEARARAKSQMGAQGTGLEIAGNNPLKFSRNAEQALRYVLNPAERGFMPAEKAVEDGFRDLQAHQLATLKAMQGALRSTLERFSPKAIRARAETKGILEKIMPGARDAALWKAYEREFSGVAFDSDEAFMDMFAKEFRKAYDELSRQE